MVPSLGPQPSLTRRSTQTSPGGTCCRLAVLLRVVTVMTAWRAGTVEPRRGDPQWHVEPECGSSQREERPPMGGGGGTGSPPMALPVPVNLKLFWRKPCSACFVPGQPGPLHPSPCPTWSPVPSPCVQVPPLCGSGCRSWDLCSWVAGVAERDPGQTLRCPGPSWSSPAYTSEKPRGDGAFLGLPGALVPREVYSAPYTPGELRHGEVKQPASGLGARTTCAPFHAVLVCSAARCGHRLQPAIPSTV